MSRGRPTRGLAVVHRQFDPTVQILKRDCGSRFAHDAKTGELFSVRSVPFNDPSVVLDCARQKAFCVLAASLGNEQVVVLTIPELLGCKTAYAPADLVSRFLSFCARCSKNCQQNRKRAGIKRMMQFVLHIILPRVLV